MHDENKAIEMLECKIYYNQKTNVEFHWKTKAEFTDNSDEKHKNEHILSGISERILSTNFSSKNKQLLKLEIILEFFFL